MAAISTNLVVRAIGSAIPLFAPALTVTKTDTLINDGAGGVTPDDDGDGKADPGETIEYTTVISNSGSDATGLTFSDIIDANTTLVGGSVNVSPLAINDSYDTIGNTLLIVGASQSTTPSVFFSGSAFDNDFDFLGDVSDSLQSYNATSVQGGTVSMDSAGRFTYLPPAGYTGTDSFTYTLVDSGSLTDIATVTINVIQRVWYVKNNVAVSGSGRSNDPFKTLAAAQTAANAANDTIYIFRGDGTTTGQNAGISLLQTGERLIGEGVALTVPVTVNSISNPTLRVSGTAPLIDNTSVGGSAISMGNISNVQISGLSIAGNTNGIDVTTTAAGSASFEISNNLISSAGVEGIDINGGGTGAVTVNIHDNTVTSTGNGIDIARTAGAVTVTTFDDNVVNGNTAGTGINIVGTGATIIFDSDTVTAGFQTVSGGTTTIGQSLNGVGTSGLVLNNVRGDLSFTDLDIYADGGSALFINSTTPNFNAGTSTGLRVVASTNTPTLTATAGPALDVTDANINLVLNNLTSSITTATKGVSLLRVSGTLTAPAASSISSTHASGIGFLVDGGSNANANVAVTYDGTVTANTGRVVQIQNVTATSTHVFTGAISASGGTGSGVSLTSNSGATVTFSGGVSLSTGTNAAFTATGGGTVNVCDENPCNPAVTGALVNTLTTTTATALNVASTNIGANNLEFRSINSTSASANSGIVLNTTGSNGGLKVVGTGSAGSGGTISNKTSTGVSLTSTANLNLNYMNITSNGDAIDENGIRAVNVSGTSSLTNLAVSSSYHANVWLENNAANTLTMTVTNSSFNSSTTHDGFHQVADSGTNTTLTISNSTFSNNFSDGLDGGIASNSAPAGTTSNVSVTTSTLDNNGANGILIYSAGSGDSRFNIFNNTSISGNPSNGINIFMNNGSLVQGKIRGKINANTITHTTGLGGYGIMVNTQGAGAGVVEVTNNVVNYNDGSVTAVNFQSGDGLTGLTAIKFSGNTINMNDTGPNDFALGAIRVEAGLTAASTRTVCLNAGATTVNLDATNLANFTEKLRVRKRPNSFFQIQGLSTNPSTTAPQVQSYLNGVTGLATSDIFVSASATYQINYTNAICDTSTAWLDNANTLVAQNQPEVDTTALSQLTNPESNSVNIVAATTELTKQNPLNTLANVVIHGKVNLGGGRPLFAPIQPAPLSSGETIDIPAFTLPAGESITIKFRATVDALDSGEVRTRILNQATVSGSNFSTISSTDPSANADAACTGAGTKTCTPVDRPDTTISSINRNASTPTNTASVSWTVTFANALSGLTSSNFTLTSSGVSGESITSVTPTGGAPATEWIVTANTGSDDGTLRLDLANDTSLSHDVTTTKPFIGQLYTIDKTAPTVTNVTSSTANGSYKESTSISIQVIFSESVTVTGTPQLTLETGTTDRTVNYVSGNGSTTLTFTYTVQAGDTSSDLDYTGTSALALNSGTIADAATNNATLTLASPGVANSLGNNKTLVIDTTAPTTTSFIRQTPSTSPTSADSLIFRASFSEAVTNVDTTDFAVNGTTTATVTNVTAFSSSAYDVTVSGGNLAGLNGDIGLNFSSSLNITDTALNALASTEPTTDELYTVDNLAPTVTSVTSTSPNGAYNAAAVIPVTVTFNEAVIVTGTPQLTLETGTTDRTVDYTSGTGTTTLTFNYTVQAGDTSTDLDYIGTSALTLNSGTITDTATINADLALPTPGAAGSLGANKSLVIDATVPTVTNVTSTKASGSYGTGVLIPVTITFSEAVTVSGTPQLTLETGTTDRTVDYTSGSGTATLTFNYTTQSGDISADLDYISASALTLNSGTIADAATNNATLTLAAPGAAGSLGANKNIVLDATEPTVTNVTSSTSNGSYTTSVVISVQVTFSEAVTVTGTPQLTLETGTTDQTVDYTSGSGTTTLTFSYTVQAGDTSADLDYVSASSLTLNSGSIQDVSTNNAILTLPAPSAAGSLGNNKAIIIDTTAPTVTNVTSSTSNGTYTTGASIPVTVTFSEAVTVIDTPQLTLETGTTNRTIDYTSGSGTATLTFTYTVQAGDTSADLDYVATTSLTLNDGSIKDAASNNAILTLAAPSAAGSLGANKAIVIDTTDPTITGVSSSITNGSYTTSQVIAVQVTFSKAVTVTGTPQLTLETGTTDRTVDYTSGSGTTTLTFNYTVQAGDTSTDLDYAATTSLALNSGTIQDAATNNAVVTLPTPGATGSLSANKAIVIDTTTPTITNITSNKVNGTYGVGTSINIQVTFSEAVNVDTTGGTPTLTLETGATDRAVSYTSGSGTATLTFTYTVQAGDISADLDTNGTSALALNSGTIKDAATNTAALTLPTPGAVGSLGANKAIVIDATPPTVTNVTSSKADGSYGATTVIAITVTFDEAVTVTGTPQLTLETGTTDRTANYTSGSGTTTLTFNYTVQAGDASGDLDYVGTNSLALNSGTIKDSIGNSATLTLVSPGAAGSLGTNKALVIDASAPETTINTNPANPTNNTSPTFTFSGDDGTGVGSLTFECKLDAGAYSVCTTPKNYAGPVANGNHTFLVRAKDSLGNTDTSPASYTWKVDTIAPTATMTSTTTNPTNVSPIPVTVQFSEITTDFVVGDIGSLVNGTVGNFVAVDGDTYTFELTPSGQGIVSAAISVGSYSDVSNLNFNTVASSFSRTYDTISPTVTINQAAGQIDPTSGAINFTAVFSDAVTGFIGTDVNLSGTAGATTATVTGGPSTYNVAVSGMTAAGTVIATIPAAKAQDAANNGNLASTSGDNSVTHIHDNISPTVLSSLRADPSPTSAVKLRFTVTFSEPVSGVDVGDFSLTMGGGVSGAVVTGISGSGSVYTVTVNAGSNNGTIRLNVLNNNSIKDALLNPLAAGFTTGQFYVIVSKTPIFIDVPYSYWANSYIERLYNAGVSGGCTNNPLAYCPDDKVTRAQMAVFLLKTIHGVSYSPPSASGTVFSDVPANYWAAAWIEQFYAEGITSGCGDGNYCPDQVSTTRAQMAIFLLRAKYGAAYTPPAPVGRFNDVPTNYWAAAWIEQLAVEGITNGCGGGNYCPENSLTRAEMAIFLVKTLNLP